jgi:unsaturated rhamnogalacturonyl hydrolase
MTRRLYLKAALAGMATLACGCSGMAAPGAASMGVTRAEVLAAITLANDYW